MLLHDQRQIEAQPRICHNQGGWERVRQQVPALGDRSKATGRKPLGAGVLPGLRLGAGASRPAPPQGPRLPLPCKNLSHPQPAPTGLLCGTPSPPKPACLLLTLRHLASSVADGCVSLEAEAAGGEEGPLFGGDRDGARGKGRGGVACRKGRGGGVCLSVPRESP